MRETDTLLEAEWRASPNFQPRWETATPSMIVLHYTGMPTASEAIDYYCDEGKAHSCHYVIDEAGAISQLVREEDRAWHAGRSYWAGNVDVNSAAIGITLANPGHKQDYKDFTSRQMQQVAALCKDISTRHVIKPQMIVANSDVAPRRKQDPGEKFDWQQLYEKGVGHWVTPEPVGDDNGLKKNDKSDEVLYLQTLLRNYGYLQGLSGKYAKETVYVVQAFQRHFRPERVDGIADRSTIMTLERLVAALPELPDTDYVSGNRPANY